MRRPTSHNSTDKDADERDLDEMLADHADAGEPTLRPAPDDPEIAAVLEQLMVERDRRWIDESVPALGGRTPREAAADPIGHHELERLLRTFDDRRGASGGFDSDRIRSLLGLG